MAISLEDKYAAVDGHGTFAGRVIAQLARQAEYRLDQNATGQELKACNAVWANPDSFRKGIVFGVLNGPLLNAESIDGITDAEIDAAVATKWDRFVSVYFPAPAE